MLYSLTACLGGLLAFSIFARTTVTLDARGTLFLPHESPAPDVKLSSRTGATKAAPSASGVFAKLEVPPHGILRVKQGSKAVIRVDPYPEESFGTLTAVIESQPVVSDDCDSKKPHCHVVFARIENPALQVYVRDYPLRSGMSVKASIITESQRIISLVSERFLGFGVNSGE